MEAGEATPDGGADGATATALADLEERNAALEDRFMRARADLENYRKRSAREVEHRVSEERERLLRDWLDAVDSVERALLMADPDSPLTVGLRAVLEQMTAILDRQGVRRVGAVGEQFDPERHEAVAVRPSDDLPDQSVMEVVRSGYAIGDRILRPAEVIVARREGAGG
jgi:molecular chaperone GrpE